MLMPAPTRKSPQAMEQSNDQLSSAVYEEMLRVMAKMGAFMDDVRERLTRIEAQDHPKGINTLHNTVEDLKKEVRTLEISITEIKTKIAPILVGVSALITGVVGFLINQ